MRPCADPHGEVSAGRIAGVTSQALVVSGNTDRKQRGITHQNGPTKTGMTTGMQILVMARRGCGDLRGDCPWSEPASISILHTLFGKTVCTWAPELLDIGEPLKGQVHQLQPVIAALQLQLMVTVKLRVSKSFTSDGHSKVLPKRAEGQLAQEG